MIIEFLKVGNMKTKMQNGKIKIYESGYNPKIQLCSNSFTAKLFYENSAVKNTISDRLNNKTVVVSNSIK